jgi:hypothetical protein
LRIFLILEKPPPESPKEIVSVYYNLELDGKLISNTYTIKNLLYGSASSKILLMEISEHEIQVSKEKIY